MSGTRRSKKSTLIEFEYRIRNFIALETEELKEGDTFEKWSTQYLGLLLQTEIQKAKVEKLSRDYTGNITIRLAKLETGSIIVGQDTLTKFQPYKSSKYGPLCDGKFDVKISLRGVDGKTALALESLLRRADLHSWQQLSWSIHDLAMKSVKIPADYRDQTRFFTNIRNKLDGIDTLVSPLFAAFGIDGIEEDFDFDSKEIKSLLGDLSSALNNIDINGEKFRGLLATYLEMYKEIMKVPVTILRDKRFDVNRAEDFGKDIFILFRHYMNLVIRYFKFDRLQYWLQEIPESYGGYFFVINDVSLNGKGPLIPIARHHHTSDMLPEDFLIPKSEWNRVQSDLGDYESLLRRSGDFTLGGIFSQASSSLEDNHLENAVILAVVGLEAAMSQVLEYFYGERAVSGTAGVKFGKTKKLLTAMNYGIMSTTEFQALSNLISKEDNSHEMEKGLIQWRNDVVHDGLAIPKEMKKRIVELTSAGRRFSYHLISWIKSEPDRSTKPRFEKSRRKPRPRTRRPR